MIKDYLKAGYPAISVLTYEPYRAEQLLPCDGWRFFAWDCIQGIKDLESKKIIEEIRDPVEAVNWLKEYADTVLLMHNLHLFMDIAEVVQSIQNGVHRWKSTGSPLVTRLSRQICLPFGPVVQSSGQQETVVLPCND